MLKNYEDYLIIKSEEINDDIALLVGASSPDDDYPYVCLMHYKKNSGSDSVDDIRCHRFYAEALADLYSRCASDYPIEFERKALRDAFEQGQKTSREYLRQKTGLQQ